MKDVIPEEISLAEYRARAQALSQVIGEFVAAAASDDKGIHLAEALLALHIIRREMEHALRAKRDIAASDVQILLDQVESQRVSFDEHFAGIAAERKAAQQ